MKIVFSADGGVTFSKPVIVSTGHPYGYASVVLDDSGNATVSWLEQGSGGGTRVLVRAINSAGAAGPVLQIAKGEKSELGYPKLVRSAKGHFYRLGQRLKNSNRFASVERRAYCLADSGVLNFESGICALTWILFN